MRVAIMTFEHVGHCPYWGSGICTHPLREDEMCELDEVSKPPDSCPCEKWEETK